VTACSPPACSWPRSVTAARAFRLATRSRPTPAKPQSRSNQANAPLPAFGAGATNDYAQRSADWPTAPATGIPGPKTTTPRLVPAATITPARYAPLAVRGIASSGAAGKTRPLMTPPCIELCNSASPSRSQQRLAGGSTSPRPGEWPQEPSPIHRPGRADHTGLIARRQALRQPRLDTGRLLPAGDRPKQHCWRADPVGDKREVSSKRGGLPLRPDSQRRGC
jgi:hypothetical protein